MKLLFSGPMVLLKGLVLEVFSQGRVISVAHRTMHEMAITQSMLSILREQMKEKGIRRLKKVMVRVGELTSVEPEVLGFCFDVCKKGTPFEQTVLDIERVKPVGRCAGCGEEFVLEYILDVCPVCSGVRVEKITGDELEIVAMEGE